MPGGPQFVRIRTGIFEEKHMARFQSGWPWVLFFWLQSKVRFKGDGVGTTLPDEPYTHEAAAAALCQPIGSVRRWFYELEGADYITTKRLRYGLEVTINKYQNGESRVSTDGQSEAVQSAHQRAVSPPPECPPMSARVPTHERQSAHQRAPSDAGIKESRAEQENKRTREGVSRERAREAPSHTPDSVRLYCQVRQTSVTKTQADLITRLVPESEEGLAAWRRAVEAVEANGIGKANVKCALDWFDRGIPERYRLPTPKSEQVAPAGPPPLPAFTPEQEAASDAARERLKLQLGRIGSGPVTAARREAAAPSFERLRKEALERAEHYGTRSDDGGSAA